jgi:DNA-3-methyladenine glycosylase
VFSAPAGVTDLLERAELATDVLPAARRLLGCTVEADTPDGTVAVRLVEVEAYRGADDPASHSYRGPTPRNRVMFGPAGHLYVYFVYGMHFCANISCLDDGEAGAVLLRAGEVASDPAVARHRRPTARRDHELARGPARLASLLGLTRDRNGVDVLDPASPVRLLAGCPIPESEVRRGPRVGVAAAHDRPWRFWIDGSPGVSQYRPGRRAVAPASGSRSTPVPARQRSAPPGSTPDR